MTSESDHAWTDMGQISVSAEVSEDATKTIDDGLTRFNESHAGPVEAIPLCVTCRDDHGEIVGGLNGCTIWHWFIVSDRWVRDDSRHRGLGSRLLTAGEQAARERGCTKSQLVTTTFQAPEFYKRFGYCETGRIVDYPPGHSFISMTKNLS